jgi:hypothetical protein
MALSGAERQARWRAKHAAELKALLKLVAKLAKDKPERKARGHKAVPSPVT